MISKDLQEMIQRDIGTNGEDEADLAPATINLDAVESAPTETVQSGTPWSWLAGIPEEEESSVKDSMTSGLPSKRLSVDGEASGSGGQPMLAVMDESKVYARECEDIVIEQKTAPTVEMFLGQKLAEQEWTRQCFCSK